MCESTRVKPGHDGGEDVEEHSRGTILPESCKASPSKFGGRRECRVFGTPAAARALVESTRVSHYRSTEIIRHSLHDGFTAYVRALPGVRA